MIWLVWKFVRQIQSKKMKVLCCTSIFHILDFYHVSKLKAISMQKVFSMAQHYKRYCKSAETLSIDLWCKRNSVQLQKLSHYFFCIINQWKVFQPFTIPFMVPCHNILYNHLHTDLKWVKQRLIIFVSI